MSGYELCQPTSCLAWGGRAAGADLGTASRLRFSTLPSPWKPSLRAFGLGARAGSSSSYMSSSCIGELAPHSGAICAMAWASVGMLIKKDALACVYSRRLGIGHAAEFAWSCAVSFTAVSKAS